VLALPGEGVPVAHEIAKAIQVPLDLMLVRKSGVPGHEELAMGIIAVSFWSTMVSPRGQQCGWRLPPPVISSQPWWS
jgi:predicted phosphoribosyltransferase